MYNKSVKSTFIFIFITNTNLSTFSSLSFLLFLSPSLFFLPFPPFLPFFFPPLFPLSFSFFSFAFLSSSPYSSSLLNVWMVHPSPFPFPFLDQFFRKGIFPLLRLSSSLFVS
eukprot:TRINITY_DN5242_c1_g1_i1.p1 TRINITY_DN5242_c1_g1~~TRINITY_DN5242_c1_g1_i1.p1  ORF type:complete len:112 (-),score=2.07 TRINITY_DN5242_c1_g1_i1:36-371(-)